MATSLNYIQTKRYRNRLSLFLQPRKSSQPGISSDSYFATTPTESDWTESCSPTISLFGSNPPTRMDSDRESIPPTTNELDTKEKARLLRKTRKLSRMFGEVPDVPQRTQSTRSRDRTPSHRRSASTHTTDSELSAIKRVPRKIPSHSDLVSSSDSGNRFDDLDRHIIPPVPSLNRDGKQSSPRNVLQTSKSLSEAELAGSTSSPTSTSSGARKQRPAKLRRFWGDSGTGVKERKSYDSSLVTASDSEAGDLHRSRSLTPDAVDFHRQYVQALGRRRQIPEDIQESPDVAPDSSESTKSVSIISATTLRESDFPDDASSRISIHSVDSMLTDSQAFDNSFRERRRRAAKLAQFFGVDYQDITTSLPMPEDLSPSMHSVVRDTSVAPVVQDEPRVQVDIKTGTRRFWLPDGKLKEAEVGDVIGKLRQLKAT